ncbi:hypothetical protein ACFFSH_28760 [Streptomyces filamentosus]|uniref:Uncharacterized protein n=1 Tax=Streptomyces filamentosus TaxID=67294 RepID=A0A919BWR6_STRFL|nr:hypothetical protein [Streptomyces filamentosus]GHG22931.1 hypothetical protein GCM10017667_68720 [Streptomyces filamentosus]
MASKRSIRQLLSAATAATLGTSLTRRPAPVGAEAESRHSEAVEIASPIAPHPYGNHRFPGQDGVVEC